MLCSALAYAFEFLLLHTVLDSLSQHKHPIKGIHLDVVVDERKKHDCMSTLCLIGGNRKIGTAHTLNRYQLWTCHLNLDTKINVYEPHPDRYLRMKL